MKKSELSKFSQIYKYNLFSEPKGISLTKSKQGYRPQQIMSQSVGKFTLKHIEKGPNSLMKSGSSQKQLIAQNMKIMPNSLIIQKHFVHQKYAAAHARTKTSPNNIEFTTSRSEINQKPKKLLIMRNMLQNQSQSQRTLTQLKNGGTQEISESQQNWFQRTNVQLLLQRLELKDQENKQEDQQSVTQTLNKFYKSKILGKTKLQLRQDQPDLYIDNFNQKLSNMILKPKYQEDDSPSHIR